MLAERPPNLPPLASTYWDLLDLRERQRDQPAHRAAREHFAAAVQDPPPAGRLAHDAPPGDWPALAVHEASLTVDETAALKQGAARASVTLYVLTFAALVEQLQRSSEIASHRVQVRRLPTCYLVIHNHAIDRDYVRSYPFEVPENIM